MSSSRITFLALTGAVLLTTAFALAPAPAPACGDKAEACPCGTACPTKHPGACAEGEKGADSAACAEKKAGACACAAAAAAAAGGAEAPAAAAPGAKANEHEHDGAHQRAVIDPATGKLVEPSEGEAPAEEPAAPAAPSQRSAAPAQVVQPGDGGVMASFPKDRTAKVAATVDESGKPHTGCEHAAE